MKYSGIRIDSGNHPDKPIILEDFPKSLKLINALVLGPVRAIGGMVFDHKMELIFSTTDMHEAVNHLNGIGLNIQRTDAGGMPTWDHITSGVKEKLQRLLEDPTIQDLTVVQMAKRDLERNDVQSAMARLRVDADKIRPTCRELYELLELL